MSYVPMSIPIRDNKNTEIGQLKAFGVPVENPKAPVIFYLHGQDATRGKNIEHTERFHQWGWNLLVIDYRGFGESYGYQDLSEATVYEDALAALRYLKDGRRFAPHKFFHLWPLTGRCCGNRARHAGRKQRHGWSDCGKYIYFHPGNVRFAILWIA